MGINVSKRRRPFNIEQDHYYIIYEPSAQGYNGCKKQLQRRPEGGA